MSIRLRIRPFEVSVFSVKYFTNLQQSSWLFIWIAMFSVVGLWAAWSSWNDCSVSCGGGTQTRYRLCDGAANGVSCAGSTQQTERCNTRSCSGMWIFITKVQVKTSQVSLWRLERIFTPSFCTTSRLKGRNIEMMWSIRLVITLGCDLFFSFCVRNASEVWLSCLI
jgi:Thrombospondin type 1 domain